MDSLVLRDPDAAPDSEPDFLVSDAGKVGFVTPTGFLPLPPETRWSDFKDWRPVDDKTEGVEHLPQSGLVLPGPLQVIRPRLRVEPERRLLRAGVGEQVAFRSDRGVASLLVELVSLALLRIVQLARHRVELHELPVGHPEVHRHHAPAPAFRAEEDVGLGLLDRPAQLFGGAA
jgi:hypothetical protein